jgi:hypothetical protein
VCLFLCDGHKSGSLWIQSRSDWEPLARVGYEQIAVVHALQAKTLECLLV